MILLHGTNIDFEEIDLIQCLPHKDFGRGFYLTPMRARAMERAKDKCTRENSGMPVILAYELDEKGLEGLKVLRFEGTTEAWLDFILQNRDKHNTKMHDYDVVIGPVADDGVITSISLFEAKVITRQILLERLKYAKPYVQYCFCTQRAVDLLHRV